MVIPAVQHIKVFPYFSLIGATWINIVWYILKNKVVTFYLICMKQDCLGRYNTKKVNSNLGSSSRRNPLSRKG